MDQDVKEIVGEEYVYSVYPDSDMFWIELSNRLTASLR